MVQSTAKNRFDPRLLLRALLVWCASAAFLLTLSAAVISLADLKASCFSLFSFLILFVSAFLSAYGLKNRTDLPSWLLWLSTALGLTIVLLTAGFLISDGCVPAEGVLLVAGGCFLGSLAGVLAAGKGKRLQKSPLSRKRRKGR